MGFENSQLEKLTDLGLYYFSGEGLKVPLRSFIYSGRNQEASQYQYLMFNDEQVT